MSKKISFTAVIGLLLSVFFYFSMAESSFFEPGIHKREFKFGEDTRKYLFYAPPAVKRESKLPVVLVFHGGAGNAKRIQYYTGFDALAKEKGFLAVYPYGTGNIKSFLTWNAGSCCAYAKRKNIDDVGMVRKLIEDLSKVAPVDRRRIYATGMSNGGMMTHRLACEAPDLIAAAAPVSGGLEVEKCNPGRAVALMHIHGTKDKNVQWEGGIGPHSILKIAFKPVMSTMERWQKINGCSSKTKTTLLPDADLRDGTKTEKVEWAKCNNGADLILIKIENGGHTWPGGPLKKWGKFGKSSKDFSGAKMIWEFFEKHSIGK